MLLLIFKRRRCMCCTYARTMLDVRICRRNYEDGDKKNQKKFNTAPDPLVQLWLIIGERCKRPEKNHDGAVWYNKMRINVQSTLHRLSPEISSAWKLLEIYNSFGPVQYPPPLPLILLFFPCSRHIVFIQFSSDLRLQYNQYLRSSPQLPIPFLWHSQPSMSPKFCLPDLMCN